MNPDFSIRWLILHFIYALFWTFLGLGVIAARVLLSIAIPEHTRHDIRTVLNDIRHTWSDFGDYFH